VIKVLSEAELLAAMAVAYGPYVEVVQSTAPGMFAVIVVEDEGVGREVVVGRVRRTAQALSREIRFVRGVRGCVVFEVLGGVEDEQVVSMQGQVPF